MSVFSQNLKQARLSRMYTQADMALILGMSVRGYRNYEIGAREPNLTDLVKIADFLGTSIDWLVGRDFPKGSLTDSE